MKIDPRIYDAMAEQGITPEAMFRCMLRGWGEIEGALLEEIAGEAVANGFNEADVRSAIEMKARELAASREQRLEVLRQMLETGTTHTQ